MQHHHEFENEEDVAAIHSSASDEHDQLRMPRTLEEPVGWRGDKKARDKKARVKRYLDAKYERIRKQRVPNK